jgi:thioredoxin-like negative regulator of GroEL
MGKLIFELREQSQEKVYHYLTQNAKVCVVDFYADWCGPCIRLGQELEKRLPDKTNIYNDLITPEKLNLNDPVSVSDKIAIVKVNIDVFSDLGNQFQVSSIPHVVYFKNGELQSGISRSCDQIFENLNKLL